MGGVLCAPACAVATPVRSAHSKSVKPSPRMIADCLMVASNLVIRLLVACSLPNPPLKFSTRSLTAITVAGNATRRNARGRGTHAVLLDLVQQGAVADFQQARRSFAIPASLVERGRDCVPLGLAF